MIAKLERTINLQWSYDEIFDNGPKKTMKYDNILYCAPKMTY